MKEWISEGMKKWNNEHEDWINICKNSWTCNEWKHERMDDWKYGWICEIMNKYVKEWMNK